MAIRKSIFLNSDTGIRIGGLTDQVDPQTKVAVSTATVTGRLYERSKVRVLLADTDGDGLTPTVVSLKNVEPFVVGEPLELRLDDGTLHETTVASRDVAADTLTMDDPVPAGRVAGVNSYAKRKLGPDIAMTLYGATPAPSVDTWGYRGAIADNHEGLYLKLKVLCEVTVDDGAARQHIFAWDAVVLPG